MPARPRSERRRRCWGTTRAKACLDGGGDTAAMSAIPRTILVAPDSFKGTFAAGDVAEAIGQGLGEGGWPVELCPVADGGEGTLDALLPALGGRLEAAAVSDPLGRRIEGSFCLSEDRRGLPVAVVESAAASGLGLVAPDEVAPLTASTTGTGELIVAALRAGATLVYLGVGGSATTDGGAGAIKAIQRSGGLGGARLVVLCDVRTPFEEAARVFGPQKGARPEDVARLTRRLHALARRFARDPRGLPMTGAAGGLAGGLWAELGAMLVPGAAFVLDLLDFDRRMRACRAVVTGEGRLDQQSLAGKAVSEVATRARQAGVPCHAIVGQRDLDSFGARVLDLQAVLEAGTRARLRAAGRRLADLI
jgi:glycerate kinase